MSEVRSKYRGIQSEGKEGGGGGGGDKEEVLSVTLLP